MDWQFGMSGHSFFKPHPARDEKINLIADKLWLSAPIVKSLSIHK
jgi:hypothetical protein